MSFLQKQPLDAEARSVTSHLPMAVYEQVVELAITKRITLSYALTHLVESALEAENGAPFRTFDHKVKELAKTQGK